MLANEEALNGAGNVAEPARMPLATSIAIALSAAVRELAL
jgi:hypothetical protein